MKSNTGLTPHWKPKFIGGSKSRMISRKLAVAGSTGSFRTGVVITKAIVWPVGVKAGTRDNESGGRKKGVTRGGVGCGNVKGGIKLLFLEELGHSVRPGYTVRFQVVRLLKFYNSGVGERPKVAVHR